MRGILLVFLLLMPFVSADLSDTDQKMDEASAIITDFFSEFNNNEMVIIQGSKVSLEEKMIFGLIKERNAQLQGIDVKPDTYSDSKLAYILIGQKTNAYSKNLDINESTTKDFSPVILKYGTLISGEKFLIAYSEREDKNNQNHAVLKSPLAGIVPPVFIPIIAVSASILLLYLWSILGNTLGNLFSDYVSSKMLRKKTKKKKIKKGEFLRFSEVLAFILTVVLFALEMSWNWSEDLGEFWGLLLLNILIVGAVMFVREFVRLIFCHKKKLKSEYVLWPVGSIVTIISTWLGNTFALASYTLLDEDVEDIKKFGKAAFLINLFTFITAFVAYILNIFFPSVFLQMYFVYCMMILFLEMFWMKPMPGNDIKRWNFPIWLIFYLIVVASYIYTNFTVYV